MKYKRVAIDLDGTLFEDEKNVDKLFLDNVELKPIKNASKATNQLKSLGFEILISTCRPDYHRKYLEGLLNKYNIAYDYILFYTKPRVDLYIDDKGFRFVDWDTTIDWITSKLSNSTNSVQGQEPSTQFEKILRKNKIKPLGNLNSFKKILDFGCGTGDTFDGLGLTNVDGYDIDINYLLECKRKNIYNKLFASMTDIVCDDYDLVCVLGVLEHIENLQEFCLDLNKFKRVYFTVPNAYSFHRIVGKNAGLIKDVYELSKQDHEIGHQRYYDKSLLVDHVKTYFPNYEIRNIGTTSFKFLPNKDMINFKDNIAFYQAAGEECNLCGENNFFGAELYCLLERP